MKNKLLVGVGVIVLLLAFLNVAFADKPIDLFVNGRVVETDVAPQLVNDRVMAPVRCIAEALGAEVKWVEKTKSVWINAPKLHSLQQQVRLLQEALTPTTPKEAAEKWAQGVKDRNGALQYAVLSPELKEQSLSDFEGFGWVTGVSSPWVEHFEITKETKIEEDTWEYEVRFERATSTGPAGSSISKVVVRQYETDAVLPSLHPNQKWYVYQVFDEDHLTYQLEKQVKDFLSKKYDQHYRIVETDVSLLSQNITDSQVEAEFSTKVTLIPVYKTPGDWPVQKGKMKYLEENRDKLSPDQIQKAEENIELWNKELLQYIDKPNECNEFLKIKAGFFWMGVIKDDTVEFYSQDPMGNYLPVKEEDWTSFKTPEELVDLGYEEMRQLVE